ncbi:hypothetical protein E3N88_39805 [Mikania micrantha]|uniref:Uncharacterized protein n=1 Tax=Mikania micrantha TaxID=192012 RepID=A0A5N6LN41_9ASTR|nr:hypothetical protein E3N88_39805 [Mikania micrantha]
MRDDIFGYMKMSKRGKEQYIVAEEHDTQAASSKAKASKATKAASDVSSSSSSEDFIPERPPPTRQEREEAQDVDYTPTPESPPKKKRQKTMARKARDPRLQLILSSLSFSSATAVMTQAPVKPTPVTKPSSPPHITKPSSPPHITKPPSPPHITKPPSPPHITKPPSPPHNTKPPSPPHVTLPSSPPHVTKPPSPSPVTQPPPPPQPSQPIKPQQHKPTPKPSKTKLIIQVPSTRPSVTIPPQTKTKTKSPPPQSGSSKGKSPLHSDSPYEPVEVPVDLIGLQERVYQLEKDAEIKDKMIMNLREGKIKICSHLNKCKGKLKAHEKFIRILLLENHKMQRDIKRLKGEEVSESEDEVMDVSDDSDDSDDDDADDGDDDQDQKKDKDDQGEKDDKDGDDKDKDQGPPDDKDQGGDSGNPSSFGKPSGLYDDLFGDIPDDILFGDCVQPDETTGAGLDNIFDDLPDYFDFGSPSHLKKDQAKSSAGASVEEEPWFDRKKDWTPAPPVDKAAWFKEMGDQHPEHTFISDDRNLFAVCNDRSNVCCWMYDKQRDIYLVKRMSGKVKFYKKPRDFCSLPKVDIRSIDKAMFFNPSKDSQADLFTKIIKDQCEKNFPVMRTAKGRCFVSSCIIDPKTKKPWVYYKYPPPHVEQAVPVSPRVPDNSLANFL